MRKSNVIKGIVMDVEGEEIDTYFDNEECFFCGRTVALVVDDDTDNYVCKRCASEMGLKTKRIR